MAYSIQRAVSDGTMTFLLISIEYFDREDITVYFDGVPNAYPWKWVGPTTQRIISFTPAVPNGVVVSVHRTTDISQPRHIFSLGAQFTTQSMDEDLRQVLQIAQEAKEGGWGESTSELREDLALPSGGTIVGHAPATGGNTSVSTELLAHEAQLEALSTPTGSSGVGFIQLGTGAVTRTVQAKNREFVSAKDFGAIADGVTDDRAALLLAMSQCVALGKTLYVPDGIYACSNWLPLPSGLKMVFAPGAVWKLTGATTLGGFVCGGYDIAMKPVKFEDVDIFGINLDCNNLIGENGFNAINANGVRLHSPKVKNAVFSAINQGGKAFQFEGALADGVHVHSPYIENCTIGINSHADPAYGTEVARHISYYGVVMKNVDVPFNIDGQFADPENGVPTNMSTFVYGANLFNCGKLTYPGATAVGSGIICGDRGYGLKISGLRVVNTTAYGAIGGLVRGTMFNVEISDVKVEAPALTAIFNFEPVGYGLPSSGAHPCTVNAADVTVLANLDYVVKGHTNGKVGNCLFDRIAINSTTASLTGLCDSQATFNGLGFLNLIDVNSAFNRTGIQSLLRLYLDGNSVSSCKPDYAEGAWTPTDASGAGLAFTLPDSCRYVRQGRLVTAFACIVYPATANGANATIGGLPFVSASFSVNAGSGDIGYSSETTAARVYVLGGTSTALVTTTAGAPIQNAAMSGDIVYLTLTYLAA